MPEDEDMILPDDFVMPTEEAATPQAELEAKEVVETAEDTKPAETTIETTTEPQNVNLKYLHEEEEVTLEEAIVLAQKGKNHDRLLDQLNQLKNDPILTFLDDQAKRNNMTREQYIEAWRANEEQAEVIELTKQNVPEEYAKEIVANRRKDQQQQSQQQTNDVKADDDKQMIEFVEAHPGVDAATIKPETWVKVKAGTPLKYAYLEQKNDELTAATKVIEQNKANQARAPIKGVSEHGSIETAEKDPFLQGFDSI